LREITYNSLSSPWRRGLSYLSSSPLRGEDKGGGEYDNRRGKYKQKINS